MYSGKVGAGARTGRVGARASRGADQYGRVVLPLSLLPFLALLPDTAKHINA